MPFIILEGSEWLCFSILLLLHSFSTPSGTSITHMTEYYILSHKSQILFSHFFFLFFNFNSFYSPTFKFNDFLSCYIQSNLSGKFSTSLHNIYWISIVCVLHCKRGHLYIRLPLEKSIWDLYFSSKSCSFISSRGWHNLSHNICNNIYINLFILHIYCYLSFS